MAVHALFANAFPFLVSGSVLGSTSLYSSSKQREQNEQLERLRGQMRQEELEIAHFHRLHEMVTRLELEKATTRELQAYREERDLLLRTYPFEAGPGELSAVVDQIFDDRLRPIIVVLEPVRGDPSGLWTNLHADARAELDELQRQGLVYAVVADRPVHWPNRRLWGYDLFDRPAIVVSPEVGADRLHLRVGGCHLGPFSPSDLLPATRMMTIEFRHSAELAKYVFTQQWNQDLHEATLVPVPRIDESDFNPFEAAREYAKLGAMAVRMLVTRLVDRYYLSCRYGYDVQFEPLVRRFDALSQAASGSSRVEQLTVPEVPEQFVRDLPYYRLTRSLGAAGRKGSREVLAAIVSGLGALVRPDQPADLAAVVKHLSVFTPNPETSGRVLQEAKTHLEALPETVEGQSRLLETVIGSLDRMQADKTTAFKLKGPKPRWD